MPLTLGRGNDECQNSWLLYVCVRVCLPQYNRPFQLDDWSGRETEGPVEMAELKDAEEEGVSGTRGRTLQEVVADAEAEGKTLVITSGSSS